MNKGAGVFLILLGIFALYLYNTGRAQAVISVLKNPAPSPSPAGGGSGGQAGGGGSSGGGGGGGFNPIATVGDILGDAAQGVWDSLGNIFDSFTAPFGIRF